MYSIAVIAVIMGVAAASENYQSEYGRSKLASLALGKGAHGLGLGDIGVGELAGLEKGQGQRLDLEAPGAGRGYAAPQAIGAQAVGGSIGYGPALSYGGGLNLGGLAYGGALKLGGPAYGGALNLAAPYRAAGYGNQGLRLRPLPAAVTAGRTKAVGPLGKTQVNRLTDALGNDIASLDYAGFDGLVESDYAVKTGRLQRYW